MKLKTIFRRIDGNIENHKDKLQVQMLKVSNDLAQENWSQK
jgi:hypothetical protein